MSFCVEALETLFQLESIITGQNISHTWKNIKGISSYVNTLGVVSNIYTTVIRGFFFIAEKWK